MQILGPVLFCWVASRSAHDDDDDVYQSPASQLRSSSTTATATNCPIQHASDSPSVHSKGNTTVS